MGRKRKDHTTKELIRDHGEFIKRDYKTLDEFIDEESDSNT